MFLVAISDGDSKVSPGEAGDHRFAMNGCRSIGLKKENRHLVSKYRLAPKEMES